MTGADSLLMRALTATDDKIRVCKNQYTGRWHTIQHGQTIADTKHHPPALAVARAQARKLPRARDTNRNTLHVVVEAVGRIGESPVGAACSGAG